MSSLRGSRRAACACGRWPERSPGWVPEIQGLTTSEASLVVMDSPIFDRQLQMALVERDHEVQTLAPEAAAEPLTRRVGQGARSEFEELALRGASPACRVLWRRSCPVVDHKRYGWSAGRASRTVAASIPPSGGGHVQMGQFSGCPFQHHEYIKDAETGRDHNEEIARHDPLGMVVDESQPTLLRVGRTRRDTRAQVLLNGAGRNPNPELQFQFVRNPFSPQETLSAAICRIRSRRFLAAAVVPSALTSSAKRVGTFAVPTDERVHLDVHQRAAPREEVTQDTIIQRVASSARRGLTFLSWKSASCLRRKRFCGRLRRERP